MDEDGLVAVPVRFFFFTFAGFFQFQVCKAAVDNAVDEQVSKVSVWIAHFFACLLFMSL